MLKKIIIAFAIAILILPVLSCNKSDDDNDYTYYESSSVMVSSFYLKSNPKVLDSLQNVFFSIDLENGRIFNADSLPYGTNVKRLLPSITTTSTAKEVTLTFHDDINDCDSTVNYLTNSTDSINFANGPVKLSIVSESGLVKREYSIEVNVHKVKSDSLAWYCMESMPLPTSITRPTAQGFAMLDGTFYCITTDGSAYALTSTTNPDKADWKAAEISLPFAARVETLRYSNDAAYMLDTDGNLMTSTDLTNWTATGRKWSYIIGGYNADIVGTVLVDGRYEICTYPSGKVIPAPADFPVENTSTPASFDVPMGFSTQIVVVGGRRADGTVTDSAWGFDGTSWVNLTKTPLPIALQDITLVPYKLVEYPSSTWKPQTYPVLMAFGGCNAEGSVSRKVYYSRDWGVTWREAPQSVQLPADVPPFYQASAFTFSTTMYAKSRASRWMQIPVKHLPEGAAYIFPAPASRISVLDTEWQCNALYLMGGKSPDGIAYTSIWRGVILEYTFRPVQ